MPPEILDEGTMSKEADVYGFGVLLWELCALAAPQNPEAAVPMASTWDPRYRIADKYNRH